MSCGRVLRRARGSGLLALAVPVLGVGLALFNLTNRATAADRQESSDGVFISEITDVQRVKLIVNKSRTFRVNKPFSTIVAGSPDIIDVNSLSDHIIYIQCKQNGATNQNKLDN
jgi:pilus assembly protein CpaC